MASIDFTITRDGDDITLEVEYTVNCGYGIDYDAHGIELTVAEEGALFDAIAEWEGDN